MLPEVKHKHERRLSSFKIENHYVTSMQLLVIGSRQATHTKQTYTGIVIHTAASMGHVEQNVPRSKARARATTSYVTTTQQLEIGINFQNMLIFHERVAHMVRAWDSKSGGERFESRRSVAG